MIESELVCLSDKSKGIISTSTFQKYRPWWVKNPSLEDGICDHCEDRREKIAYVHRHFPKTNPEYKYKGMEAYKSWLLHPWKKNSLTYPTVKQLLKKFDPLFDHSLRKSKELRDKMSQTLTSLNSLEKHFHLQLLYLSRNRAIDADFVRTLGGDCVRVTHDSKNPLIIGLGGPGGVQTTQQKRVLGICACVGTMVEYADENKENTQACRAYAMNLSLNKDKTSYATLQHLYNSLKQPHIKKIISKP